MSPSRRRRAPRLTVSKKRSNATSRRRRRGGDPEAPSDLEWESLEAYASFVVEDDDETKHIFKQGDHVLILPPTMEPGGTVKDDSEYWVALVREIRCRNNDPSDVWVKVQWYYSPKDVHDVVKSFDTTSCGKYERIFSDHYDYVHSTTLDASVTMSRYEENSVEQHDIKSNEFYCRYVFERDSRTVSPKPGGGTCICDQPYDPNDNSSLMHFCPRPSCRRSFHQQCLIQHPEYQESVSPARLIRLICTSPDTDEDFVVPEASPASRKTPRGAKRSTKKPASGKVTNAMLSGIPPDLLAAAHQPIVKGGQFPSGGLVGNIRPVVLARRLVHRVLEGSELPADWKVTDDVELARAIVKIPRKKKIPCLICPGCKGPI